MSRSPHPKMPLPIALFPNPWIHRTISTIFCSVRRTNITAVRRSREVYNPFKQRTIRGTELRRMRVTIHRLCVCCADQNTRISRARFFTEDPGSCYVAAWSHMLPCKRKINVHTLCDGCLGKEKGLSRHEADIIGKRRAQFEFNDRATWIRREWHFWMVSSEWQSLETRLKRDDHLRLEVGLRATLQ